MALVVLFTAAVLWAMLFARAAHPRNVSRASVLVFLVVFTTLPVQAYYLTFDICNIEMSLGFTWAAASGWCAWLAVVEQRGRLLTFAAVVFSVLAVLTFQSFIFALIAGVLVAQVARILSTQEATGVAVKQTVLLLAPAVVAMALAFVFHMLFVERDSYVEGFISWGTLDIVAIIRRLGGWGISYLVGNGFFGGWVLVPTAVAAVIVVALTIRASLRQRRWYPTRPRSRFPSTTASSTAPSAG